MRTAILFSGRGSNLGALARAAIDPNYPAEFVLAVTNLRNAPGIEIARDLGVPVRVVPHAEFDSREAHEAVVTQALAEAKVQLVCLAGYMRILSDTFVQRWRGKCVNIHPALLPSFRGVDTHARALERGVRIHGCTVHYVNGELDGGPIVAQAAVPVLAGDDEETLGARVLAAEHELYPACVGMIAAGRVRWSGGGVVVSRDVEPAAIAIGLDQGGLC